MIKLAVNNGCMMEITQAKTDSTINIKIVRGNKTDNNYNVSPADMVMLLNYYRYIKDNDIHCVFVNVNGTK